MTNQVDTFTGDLVELADHLLSNLNTAGPQTKALQRNKVDQLKKAIKSLKKDRDIQPLIDRYNSVCRIDTSGGQGTGFYIGANLILTNAHIIESNDTSGCKATFNVWSGSDWNSKTYALDGTSFYCSSPSPSEDKEPDQSELDYAVVALGAEPQDLLNNGILPIKESVDKTPEKGSTIWMIGHPADRKDNPRGKSKLVSYAHNHVIKSSNGVYFRHSAANSYKGGASGSPCLDKGWKLAGLMRAGQGKEGGKWDEEAIDIDAIIQDLHEKHADALMEHLSGIEFQEPMGIWDPNPESLYEQGHAEHVQENFDTAFKLFSYSANLYQKMPDFSGENEKNRGNAYWYVGNAYHRGRGAPAKDKMEAKEWYTLGKEAGDSDSTYHLALILKDETSDKQKQACSLFKEVANGGDRRAMYHLGRCHYQGVGTAQDTQKAIYWLQQADKKGYPQAKELLKETYLYKQTRGELFPTSMSAFRIQAVGVREAAKAVYNGSPLTEGYKKGVCHETGFVAKTMEQSREEEKECLTELEQSPSNNTDSYFVELQALAMGMVGFGVGAWYCTPKATGSTWYATTKLSLTDQD